MFSVKLSFGWSRFFMSFSFETCMCLIRQQKKTKDKDSSGFFLLDNDDENKKKNKKQKSSKSHKKMSSRFRENYPTFFLVRIEPEKKDRARSIKHFQGTFPFEKKIAATFLLLFELRFGSLKNILFQFEKLFF